MSKLTKIGYYNRETGEEISNEIFNSINSEEKNNKVREIYSLFKTNPSKLTLDDLIILMKLEKRPSTSPNEIKLDFGEDGYFTCRRDINLVLQLHDYTKAFLYSISHMITHDGRLKYSNNRIIPTLKLLRNRLNISDGTWNRHIKPDIEKFNIIKKEKIDDKWCLLLNPMYVRHSDFEWYKEIFDLFEEDIKLSLPHLHYLKIKSEWYNTGCEIGIKDFIQLSQNIQGIYKLYRNDKVVYIGKSINIKNRVLSHIKDNTKEFDSFDFTIIPNNSNMNVYEIFYIDYYKPEYNRDCLEETSSTIDLKPLTFSHKINIERS